ncbi:MAG: hypothetical protein QG577_574, partial [Thermodesulfobacteriota bacterium]|nr:hypothetical protein [Thermodesulfobacteriota bacterium]
MPVAMILWFLMSLGIVSLIIVDDGTGDSSAGRILAQARSERDLPKRIALIDEALKDQSLKGKMLSALFFERAMAYK